MTQERIEISDYELSRLTNKSNKRATIHLFSSGQLFALLNFFADNVPLNIEEWNYSPSVGTIILVPYPIEAYPDVVDILRNEKPVYLTYNVKSGYARVESGEEPVGEEETFT